MNIEQLREELKVDEGVKYEIYLDHLGLPTCGIGHLITDQDPEHGLEVGTKIDEERVNELFDQDVEVTTNECRLLVLLLIVLYSLLTSYCCSGYRVWYQDWIYTTCRSYVSGWFYVGYIYSFDICYSSVSNLFSFW